MSSPPQPAESVVGDIALRLREIEPSIPKKVRTIAVTKTFPAAIVAAAHAAGIRDFAENKVQEAILKQAELSTLTDVTWHFIGHVQSNKTRKVLEHFDWIHSVDSLKLATRLNRQAAELGKRPTCCLQVKLAHDPTKDGFEPDELLLALPDLDQLEHLNIVGLMVIAPYRLPPKETQAVFTDGKALSMRIAKMGLTRITMSELSMGMSGDYVWAIAAGATVIRLGSRLFGHRKNSQKKA